MVAGTSAATGIKRISTNIVNEIEIMPDDVNIAETIE